MTRPAIKIHGLNRKAVVTDADYDFMQAHLGEWLSITSVNFRGGELYDIVVEYGIEICTIFFTEDSMVEFSLRGISFDDITQTEVSTHAEN